MNVAIVGAGWAGLAAAIECVRAGHRVTVYEAARTPGGRARALDVQLPDGRDARLDNGQHILIGAYTESLRLLQLVGVDLQACLLRLPLTLQYPDGRGLRLPDAPPPLDLLTGLLRARHWPWQQRLALLRTAMRWRRAGFACEPQLTVAQLCASLGPAVRRELIEPLCVSALNTPAAQASAQVFLRVLRDALFAGRGGSQLLLPRCDLGALFANPARLWLQAQGAHLLLGQRAAQLTADAAGWRIDQQPYEAVILACAAPQAARLVFAAAAHSGQNTTLSAWGQQAQALTHEAIATVYAWGAGVRLPQPLLALHHGAAQPAQFVFDRGQLGGPRGLLAFVVSAACGTHETLQAQVLLQARSQLGLQLQPVQTVVEKRATFACTPQRQRPPMHIAPALLACGDYVEGPYPATLEGAVRSGVQAARSLPA
jgi:squalene-associated FAD-dependent desaturase